MDGGRRAACTRLALELQHPHSSTDTAAMAADPTPLRLASFNLLSHGYTKFNTSHTPGAPLRTLESVSQQGRREAMNMGVIAALGVDVLLTQEQDFTVQMDRSRFPYQATIATEDRAEGCAVLSSIPILRSRGVDLLHGKTAVVATLSNGLTVVSMHLKGGVGCESDQRAQLQRILQFVSDPGPCVLAGDMNCIDPEGTHGRLLADAGFRKAPGTGPTGMTSDFSQLLELDHVYFRDVPGTVTIQPVTGVPMSPWEPEAFVGSDHVPLVFSVGLAPQVSPPSSDAFSPSSSPDACVA